MTNWNAQHVIFFWTEYAEVDLVVYCEPSPSGGHWRWSAWDADGLLHLDKGSYSNPAQAQEAAKSWADERGYSA